MYITEDYYLLLGLLYKQYSPANDRKLCSYTGNTLMKCHFKTHAN